ncbi:ATP-binding protein [Streptomyces sp. NPDC047000]|uniref:ATP-binding protein n=1 Tax=Streptomyces sp. NPDC047000 TaxID=3155474 RepID=UPI0033FAFBED
MDTLSDVREEITRTRSSVSPRPCATEPRFTVPLSATRRGARLARLLATEQLRTWEVPLDPARLIVAELATNAVLHARVPGRSFRLTLTLTAPATLRIEVTDARGDRRPETQRAPGTADGPPRESGYGLLLVRELADRWGVRADPVPCKTVWAELDLGQVVPSEFGGTRLRARP